MIKSSAGRSERSFSSCVLFATALALIALGTLGVLDVVIEFVQQERVYGGETHGLAAWCAGVVNYLVWIAPKALVSSLSPLALAAILLKVRSRIGCSRAGDAGEGGES